MKRLAFNQEATQRPDIPLHYFAKFGKQPLTASLSFPMSKTIQLTIDNPSQHFDAVAQTDNLHHYIQFSSNARTGVNTEAGFMIIEHFLKQQQTRKQWTRDERVYVISQEDHNGNVRRSQPINYRIIARFIREHGYFDPAAFDLMPMECRWMDFSLDMSFNAQFKDPHNDDIVKLVDGTAQEHYGPNYPIKPTLDREGRSFSTLLPLLLRRIIRLRNQLIASSQMALLPEWFLDLRTLITDSVSVLEITLNQLYIKAQYDPLPGWEFDVEKLKGRNARRFKDKLGWVYQISGNHLEAELHLAACDELREVRNHLSHFDPPSLTVTIEEMTKWLNYIIDVGYLIIKIRRAIGAELSYDLVNFILQREAIFVPGSDFNGRIPLPEDGSAGYRSTTWKAAVT